MSFENESSNTETEESLLETENSNSIFQFNFEASALSIASAMASWLRAKAIELAEALHKSRYIYGFYGALDGLNLAYSNLNCFFNLYFGSASNGLMHQWMLSPAGIAAVATESIFLIAFGMLANYFKDDDANDFKRYTAIIWPYLRDVFKATKNAYKGFNSFIGAINKLGGINVSNLIVPVSLGLGAILVATRLFLRYMRNKRKDLMDANEALLLKLLPKPTLTPEEIDGEIKFDDEGKVISGYRTELKRQKEAMSKLHIAGFIAAGIGGLVDSFYLYMGVIGLCSLNWPALVAVLSFCLVFSAMCLATRLYEEYDYQRRLWVSHSEVELAICTKLYAEEMRKAIKKLNKLAQAISQDPDNKQLEQKQKTLKTEIEAKIIEYNTERNKLQKSAVFSDVSVILAGLKDGLSVYSAVTSVVFGISMIASLCGVGFPPALLISVVAIGMLCLIAFTYYSYKTHQIHRQQVDEKAKDPEKLIDFIEIPKTANAKTEERILDNISTSFKKYETLDKAPTVYVYETSEVFRSFWSGIPKGCKAAGYMGNSLDNDSVFLWILTGINTLMYSVVFALRAHARGFGKPRPGQQLAKNDASKDIELEKGVNARNLNDNIQDEEAEEKLVREALTHTATSEKGEPPIILATPAEEPNSQQERRFGSIPNVYRSASVSVATSMQSFFKNRTTSPKNLRSNSNPDLVSLEKEEMQQPQNPRYHRLRSLSAFPACPSSELLKLSDTAPGLV